MVVQPPLLFAHGGGVGGVEAYAALLTLFGSLCAAAGMITIRTIGPGIDPLLPGQSPPPYSSAEA